MHIQDLVPQFDVLKLLHVVFVGAYIAPDLTRAVASLAKGGEWSALEHEFATLLHALWPGHHAQLPNVPQPTNIVPTRPSHASAPEALHPAPAPSLGPGSLNTVVVEKADGDNVDSDQSDEDFAFTPSPAPAPIRTSPSSMKRPSGPSKRLPVRPPLGSTPSTDFDADTWHWLADKLGHPLISQTQPSRFRSDADRAFALHLLTVRALQLIHCAERGVILAGRLARAGQNVRAVLVVAKSNSLVNAMYELKLYGEAAAVMQGEIHESVVERAVRVRASLRTVQVQRGSAEDDSDDEDMARPVRPNPKGRRSPRKQHAAVADGPRQRGRSTAPRQLCHDWSDSDSEPALPASRPSSGGGRSYLRASRSSSSGASSASASSAELCTPTACSFNEGDVGVPTKIGAHYPPIIAAVAGNTRDPHGSPVAWGGLDAFSS